MAAGSSQTLTCRSSVKGNCIYLFFKNGKKIKGGKSNKLVLKKLNRKHLGKYRCRVLLKGQKAWSASYELFVKVTTPLTATLIPSNPSPTMASGTTEILTCKSSLLGKGITYIFAHNGKHIQTGPKNKLVLKGLKAKHTGNYQCRVKLNGKQANSKIYKMVIKVHPPLTATMKPSSPKSPINVGASLTLTCFTDLPGKKVVYNFYHNGKKIQHGHKNELRLKGLKKANIGNYQCRVTLNGKHADSVIYKLVLGVGRPVLFPNQKPTVILTAGETFTFICQGAPGCTFTFYRDGKKLQSGKDSMMILKGVTAANAGHYYCAAHSEGAISLPSNRLEIIIRTPPPPPPPTCTGTFPGGKLTYGGQMTLNCKSPIKGKVTYTFYKDGKKIHSSNKPAFTIKNIDASKAGKYSCAVTVHGTTSAIGGTFNIVIHALTATLTQSNPSAMIAEGSTETLTCKSSHPAKNAIYIFWHNGKKVQTAKKNTLVLKGLKVSQGGNYQCQVKLGGKTVESKIIKIHVKAHPPLTCVLKPSKQAAYHLTGVALTLNCITDQPGKGVIYTFRRGVHVIQKGHKNQYHLGNLKMSQKGDYSCIVTHGSRTKGSAVWVLRIKEAPPATPTCIATFPGGKLTYGGDMTLNCKSAIKGKGTYTFFKNGKKIHSSHNPVFTIKNMDASKSGKYSCKVTVNGAASGMSGTYSITIKAPPIIPNLVPSKSGDSHILSCNVKAKGRHTYYFYKDGKQIKMSGSHTLNLGTLSHLKPGKHTYSCKAKVNGKMTMSSGTYTITLEAPPIIPTLVPSQGANGHTLTCNVKAKGKHYYFFYKDGKKIQGTGSNTLAIGSLTPGKHVYSCKVQVDGKLTSVMTGMSGTYTVTVEEKPCVPALVPSKTGTTLQGGDHQTLTCKVDKKGTHTYIFYKDGKKIRENGNHELELASLDKSEAGKYTCQVKVNGGKLSEMSGAYTLTVNVVTIHQPHLKPTNPKGEMPAGLDQILTCETKNTGDILYTFLKDGKVIQNGKDKRLMIQELSPKDSGKYSCMTTLMGKDSSHSNAYSLKVTVSLERPTLSCSCTSSHVWIGESVTLTCGKPAKGVTFIWYKAGKEIHKGASHTFTLKDIKADNAGIYSCASVAHGHTSEASNKFPIQVMKKCNAHIDLLFLVDKSASIKPHQFVKSKEFMQKMVAKFEVSSDVVRVGTVLFANGPHNGFCFDKYMDKPSLVKAIGALSCPKCKRGKTATAAALQYARENSLTDACGAREDAKKIIVVITDGKSTEKADYVSEQAEEMKMIADEVITVGVGKYKRSELEMIATQDEFVFTTDDFSKLDGMLNNVATKTCEAGAAGSDYDDHHGDYDEEDEWEEDDEGFDSDWDDTDEMDWEWDKKKK